jgi:hypothetical protein
MADKDNKKPFKSISGIPFGAEEFLNPQATRKFFAAADAKRAGSAKGSTKDAKPFKSVSGIPFGAEEFLNPKATRKFFATADAKKAAIRKRMKGK